MNEDDWGEFRKHEGAVAMVRATEWRLLLGRLTFAEQHVQVDRLNERYLLHRSEILSWEEGDAGLFEDQRKQHQV